ncbi:SDR family NAD(P)-dependent oxidoreductase [Leekyejoonella antrihumi]|uniref:SDR family NAD(P)-dependent oxidoreductase n=1 Tax=Leekyejoonella antrihumi TaxID=1660198 RepID=UPI001648D657|nr:SDR family oxidoreductase [Leekyejoonella antrihumi]
MNEEAGELSRSCPPQLSRHREGAEGGRGVLDGCNALVTGSTRGIGKAIAERLILEGASVIVTGRDDDAGHRLCQTMGPSAEFVSADLRSKADVARLVAVAVARNVDILVNNAGVYRFTSTQAVTVDEFDLLVDTNLRATFFLTQSVLESMRERRRGRVVNVTTTAAYRPNGDCSAYAATKAAVASLSKSWAAEYGRYGILVNTVAPGVIYTDTARSLGEDVLEEMAARASLRRIGTAEEVASAVFFLVSPSCSYTSGITLFVDGGMLVGV